MISDLPESSTPDSEDFIGADEPEAVLPEQIEKVSEPEPATPAPTPTSVKKKPTPPTPKPRQEEAKKPAPMPAPEPKVSEAAPSAVMSVSLAALVWSPRRRNSVSVSLLQDRLNTLGYAVVNGDLRGWYHNSTREAVSEWQKDNGFDQTGELNLQQAESLFSKSQASVTL